MAAEPWTASSASAATVQSSAATSFASVQVSVLTAQTPSGSAWLSKAATQAAAFKRRGIEAALPHLEKSGAGSVLCISSTGAVEEFMGVQPYNALKAAVMAYSSAQSQALAPKNIRVNCITPGPVWTEDGPWPQIKEGMPDFFGQIMGQMPLGKMTDGTELAKAIAFVASPVCSTMTGANIVVDSGITKRNQF